MEISTLLLKISSEKPIYKGLSNYVRPVILKGVLSVLLIRNIALNAKKGSIK
jgi:hypothetical protein